MTARPARRRWEGEGGQTVTEYLMIAGLLTAMIIVLTGVLVPGVIQPVAFLVGRMMFNLSTPP